jgi:uncharacterized protein (TIGR02466 family)
MQDIEIDGTSAFCPIFPTPVGIYTDNQFLDIKDDFVKMCYFEKELTPSGRTVSNRNGGWQSGNDWFFEDRNKSFNTYLHKMVEKFFYEIFDHHGELSFSLECWININPKGAYNVSHTHPNCDYAGVFYINLPQDESYSPSIVFDSPHNHCYGDTYSMYSDNLKLSYGIYPEIEVYPPEGSIIVFPSHLRHFVDDNQTDEDRISVAFNINITNYGRFGVHKNRGRIAC